MCNNFSHACICLNKMPPDSLCSNYHMCTLDPITTQFTLHDFRLHVTLRSECSIVLIAIRVPPKRIMYTHARHTHAHTCTHMYTHAHTYEHMHMHMHIQYVHTHMHTHLHTHVQMLPIYGIDAAKLDLYTHIFSSFQIIFFSKRHLCALQLLSYALDISLSIMELQGPECLITRTFLLHAWTLMLLPGICARSLRCLDPIRIIIINYSIYTQFLLSSMHNCMNAHRSITACLVGVAGMSEGCDCTPLRSHGLNHHSTLYQQCALYMNRKVTKLTQALWIKGEIGRK